jgi:hypothetical protein
MNLILEKARVMNLVAQKQIKQEEFEAIAAKYAHLMDVYPLQFLHAIKLELAEVETPEDLEVTDTSLLNNFFTNQKESS